MSPEKDNTPTIVSIGRTPMGSAIAIDMSQELIDEYASKPGTSAWEHDGTRLTLLIRRDTEMLPLVTFDTTDDHHVSALVGVLDRGTLHIAAAAGVQGEIHTGGKIAFTIGPTDRDMIERALTGGASAASDS